MFRVMTTVTDQIDYHYHVGVPGGFIRMTASTARSMPRVYVGVIKINPHPGLWDGCKPIEVIEHLAEFIPIHASSTVLIILRSNVWRAGEFRQKMFVWASGTS